jgi:hypothetical protein
MFFTDSEVCSNDNKVGASIAVFEHTYQIRAHNFGVFLAVSVTVYTCTFFIYCEFPDSHAVFDGTSVDNGRVFDDIAVDGTEFAGV